MHLFKNTFRNTRWYQLSGTVRELVLKVDLNLLQNYFLFTEGIWTKKIWTTLKGI